MNNINYQKELEKIIEKIIKEPPTENEKGTYRHPKLLLHSCCAPCSSYCMEYLREYFDITVFYYNPNISSDEEYRKRASEEKRLIEEFNAQIDESCKDTYRINIIEGDYVPDEFYSKVRGYEQCEEGGERCFICYELRLQKSFDIARENGFEYVTTTLTISPLKNAAKINEIGVRLGDEKTKWLFSDFKKKNGYKRSIELSRIYNLYRQNFCGCVFSK